MRDSLLHTPDGLRDIYGSECRRRNIMARKLTSVLELYGYQDIQTPTFEFFDIFNHERGTVSSRDMYKFIDRDGSTLVLRPDITPSIARAVAKYFRDETVPMRFSYCGSTFLNSSSLQGKLKETTQIGAELVMDPDIEGDAELIALAVHMLLEAGLEQFQIDIGHIGLFRVLAEEAGLNEEEEENLRQLIESKNYFAVETFLDELAPDHKISPLFSRLPVLFGNVDVLEKAREMTDNPRALSILDYLRRLYGLVVQYGFEKYVTIDLGMLTDYDYYTGIIFRGYTYGTGDAIVKGGRYDNLIGQFGKSAASVGFAIVLDELMLALSRQDITVPTGNGAVMVLYPRNLLPQAIKIANLCRKAGTPVSMIREDGNTGVKHYLDYCRKYDIESIVHILDQTAVEEIRAADGSTVRKPFPADQEGERP